MGREPGQRDRDRRHVWAASGFPALSRQPWEETRGSKIPWVTARMETGGWTLQPQPAGLGWKLLFTHCLPNPPRSRYDCFLFFFPRKNGRTVLQQQLYYVQPFVGAGDRGAGDRLRAELQHLNVHHCQHGGLFV